MSGSLRIWLKLSVMLISRDRVKFHGLMIHTLSKPLKKIGKMLTLLVMPIGDPRDGFVSPTLTLMMDSYTELATSQIICYLASWTVMFKKNSRTQFKHLYVAMYN